MPYTIIGASSGGGGSGRHHPPGSAGAPPGSAPLPAGSGGGNNGGNGGGGEATVTRFAGQPGAVTALRVDYGGREKAFASHEPRSALGQVRREVHALARGPALGDRPGWNGSSATAASGSYRNADAASQHGGPPGSVHFAPPSSSVCGSVPGLPQRPQMHQNAAFQAVKLDYNFRAATLPPVRELLYIPKHNKMEADRSLFLSKDEAGGKTILTRQCLTTGATLSRCEGGNNLNGTAKADFRPLDDTFGSHMVRKCVVTDGPEASMAQRMQKSQSAPHQHSTRSGGGNNSVPSTLRDQLAVQAGGPGWSASTALAPDRVSVYKLREYEDGRAHTRKLEGTLYLKGVGGTMPNPYHFTASNTMDSLNNTTTTSGGGGMGDGENGGAGGGLSTVIDVGQEMAAAQAYRRHVTECRRGVYRSPVEYTQLQQQTIREAKLAARQAAHEEAQRKLAEEEAAGGRQRLRGVGAGKKGASLGALTGGPTFTLSNRDLWWSKLPPELEAHRAALTASHISAATALNKDSDAAGGGGGFGSDVEQSPQQQQPSQQQQGGAGSGGAGGAGTARPTNTSITASNKPKRAYVDDSDDER